MHRSFLLVVAMVAILAFPVSAQEATPVGGEQAAPLTVVASGLINPRGVTWTADGTLWVAQAGSGGQQLGTPVTDPPLGPVRGGSTASVVRIEGGCPILVAGGLPSVITATNEVLGVEDLAILGDQLYAAVDGGGESHGNAAQPSGVYRILGDGTSELVADLSAWVRANPVAHVPPDFDPDAAGFGMVADAATNSFWVNNPNSGEILNVTLDGTVTRVVDLSEGHPVPTGLATAPQGGVYVGNLTAVPYPDGAAHVIHVAPGGAVTEVWTGLTAVTDVAVGPDGALYAVEMSTGNPQEPPFIRPNSGRIVRQTGLDTMEEVATGLMLPVAASFGPDGGLYVSIPAAGADHGEGYIARIDVGAAPLAATPAALESEVTNAACVPAPAG